MILAAMIAATPTSETVPIIVGRTCGPSYCTPVLAAPAPAATPLVTAVSLHCGELLVDADLIDQAGMPVAIPTELQDVLLVVGDMRLHPVLRTDRAIGEIPPGQVRGPVRYSARLAGLPSGDAVLTVGPLPKLLVQADADEACG